MSILVSWTGKGVDAPLARGLYPAGLSHVDFDGPVETEGTGGVYAGYYNGVADVTDFGMSPFVMPVSTVVEPRSYPTLKWLRDELGEAAESATRAYGLNSSNPNYISVQVFMDMIRDRINDSLIISDDAYKSGVLLIEAVGVIDDVKADSLLALGGHSR